MRQTFRPQLRASCRYTGPSLGVPPFDGLEVRRQALVGRSAICVGE
jgi:hypothetical protein